MIEEVHYFFFLHTTPQFWDLKTSPSQKTDFEHKKKNCYSIGIKKKKKHGLGTHNDNHAEN